MDVKETLTIANMIDDYMNENDGKFIGGGDDWVLDIITVLVHSQKYNFRLESRNGEYSFTLWNR